jgi:S-adenosylmethionine hydrolase
MTNVSPADAPPLFAENPPPFKIIIGKTEITHLLSAYAQASPGEVFAILGSSGYLEFASFRASAAQTLGIGKGAEVGIVFG